MQPSGSTYRAALIALIFCIAGGGAEAAGALAIGQCGAFGRSYGFRTEAQASDAARRECQDQQCQIVTTIRNACVAYAIDGANPCGAHGYASAPRLAAAQNSALRQCYKFGGKDCVIRTWACDGRAH